MSIAQDAMPHPESRVRDRFVTGGPATSAIAVADIARALSDWELWLTMAWQDIKQRYRGSMLGPFWVTINMGVMVGLLAIIYGKIFGTPMAQYLPYLTLGFLSWLWMSNTANESTQQFVLAHRYIKQVRLPITLFMFRLLARNIIILAHNFVVYVIVAIIVGLNPGWSGLLAISGLLLSMMFMFWMGLLFAMLGARFRDIPQIITSIIQVVFYITPILWQPGQLGRRQYLVVDYNPAYYFIEIVRGPLLGHPPPIGFWKVTILMTLAMAAIVFPLFRRFRGRVAYWV